MARMPGAQWKPITGNFTPKGQVEVRGVVLHIMVGTLTGTDGWFRNPRAQASSHFGTGRDKRLTQWVDTKDRAWAQADGNRSWLSVENEGVGGDELTDDQLDSNAAVLAWAHQAHGVPLQVATEPSGRGLGHHGMGGRAWGNHPDCPGSRIIAQKPEIVRRAKLLLAPKPAPDPTEALVKKLPTLGEGDTGWDVKTVHHLLLARDAKGLATVDPTRFTAAHTAAVRIIQRDAGVTVDGLVGGQTWSVLLRVA